MWDLPRMVRTHVPCIGRQILNHCATREALHYCWITYFLFEFLKFFGPWPFKLDMRYSFLQQRVVRTEIRGKKRDYWNLKKSRFWPKKIFWQRIRKLFLWATEQEKVWSRRKSGEERKRRNLMFCHLSGIPDGPEGPRAEVTLTSAEDWLDTVEQVCVPWGHTWLQDQPSSLDPQHLGQALSQIHWDPILPQASLLPQLRTSVHRSGWSRKSLSFYGFTDRLIIKSFRLLERGGGCTTLWMY